MKINIGKSCLGCHFACDNICFLYLKPIKYYGNKKTKYFITLKHCNLSHVVLYEKSKKVKRFKKSSNFIKIGKIYLGGKQ